MNIEQYRAIKAQEEAERNQPVVEQPNEPEVVEPEKVDEVETKEEESKIDVIEIDGKEITVEELKNGYLRQSDYTKKTQEVARTKKEVEDAVQFYEMLKQNPEMVQQLKQNTPVPRNLDPTQAQIIEIENKMYDMMLEREIETLQSKYGDFEVREVLELARDKGMSDLEDAYLLLKSKEVIVQKNDIDIEEIKKTLREELMEELKNETSTQSVISKNGSTEPPKVKEVQVSEQERRVASHMGMTIDEYVKWRDVN